MEYNPREVGKVTEQVDKPVLATDPSHLLHGFAVSKRFTNLAHTVNEFCCSWVGDDVVFLAPTKLATGIDQVPRDRSQAALRSGLIHQLCRDFRTPSASPPLAFSVFRSLAPREPSSHLVFFSSAETEEVSQAPSRPDWDAFKILYIEDVSAHVGAIVRFR